jgi:tetratricopeptide (TPR) repeat protein
MMRRVSAVLAFVAACLGIHCLCIVPFRDNLVMREVEERTMLAENTTDPVLVALLARTNLADLERIARSRRLDPAWYVLTARNAEALGRWTDASNAYTHALAIDQRPEIYFARGLLMLQLGRTDAAASDMTAAVRFDPQYLDQIEGDLRARVAAKAEVR